MARTLLHVIAGAVLVAGISSVSARPSAAEVGPCTAAETRQVAFAFARAWTRGDLKAIDRLVAREPHFRWVSAGPPGMRSGSRAFDRRSLAAFIRARHAQHERLALTHFHFNGSDVRGTEGFGHFEFAALRLSDDASAVGDIHRVGKGAIICTLERPMIAVWSLG
jgi:hypothetical protein